VLDWQKWAVVLFWVFVPLVGIEEESSGVGFCFGGFTVGYVSF